MIIDGIDYKIDKGKRKNIYIAIKDGIVIVKTPKYISNKQIEDIVYKKKDWIYKNLEEYNKMMCKKHKKYINGEVFKILGENYILKIVFQNVVKSKIYIDSNELILILPLEYENDINLELYIKKGIEKFYLELSQNVLESIMKKVTNQVGLHPNKYRIRKLKSSWGSCSSTKNISIALKLIEHSPRAYEYVVLHEVCHLRYMNHSREFWNMVEHYMKDYKDVQKELKKA